MLLYVSQKYAASDALRLKLYFQRVKSAIMELPRFWMRQLDWLTDWLTVCLQEIVCHYLTCWCMSVWVLSTMSRITNDCHSFTQSFLFSLQVNCLLNCSPMINALCCSVGRNWNNLMWCNHSVVCGCLYLCTLASLQDGRRLRWRPWRINSYFLTLMGEIIRVDVTAWGPSSRLQSQPISDKPKSDVMPTAKIYHYKITCLHW